MPDGVLPCEVERVRRDVDRQQHDLVGMHPAAAQVRGDRDRDRAAPRPDIEHPQLVARRPHAHHQPPHDLLDRQVDQPLRLGSRDERPGVDGEHEPVELLDAADVRDGLAGQPPVQRRPERPLRAGPDLRVGMGVDRRALHADGMAEEQLRVEPGRLDPGRPQALDGLGQEWRDRRHPRIALRAGW